jgi:hypothetical protein
MVIGGFSAGNNKFRCDLREADRVLTGFQDHRLQPLGHLPAKAKYTVTRYLRGTPLTGAATALFQTATFNHSATSPYIFANNSSRQPLTVAIVPFAVQ